MRMSEQSREATVGLDPWRLFETRLAAYLSTMIDPSDEDFLTLTVPGGDTSRGGVIEVFPLDGATAIRANMAGDYTTRDIADTADLARAVRECVWFRHALPHPDLLTVSARGPAARGVAILGLADDAEVRSGATPDTGVLEVLFPADHEELLGLVLAHLRQRYDKDLDLDGDGDIPVVVDGVGLWVRVWEGGPVLQVFTTAISDVHSRRQTDAELNVLNRDHSWTRWVRRGRAVCLQMSIPGYPFAPVMIDEMLRIFAHDHNVTRYNLVDRLGGTAVG